MMTKLWPWRVGVENLIFLFYKRLKQPPKVEAREPIPLKGKSQPVANYLAKY